MFEIRELTRATYSDHIEIKLELHNKGMTFKKIKSHM